MDDAYITEPSQMRSESGLRELKRKYERLILKICRGVLKSPEDVEECANDTLLAVWEGMERDDPANLTAYVCKIARRKSLNRLRYNTAPMRSSDLLTELDECLPSTKYSPENAFESTELTAALNEWLSTLPEKQRTLFMRRYFFSKSVKDAAHCVGMSVTAATTALSRLRDSLNKYLTERGFDNEMNALGAVNQHKSEYTYEWKTLPSSLFKTFGISPIMNDFFSEEECENFVWVNYTIDGIPANTTIDYELTSKNLNKAVKFQIFCMNKEGAGLNTSLIASAADEDKMETLTLKDESKAIICEDFLGGYNIYVSSANFSYDGIAYSLTIRDGNNNDMKQVLTDLGVL